ncbi:MAG: hypothetical protein MHM6MM_004139 [Cercozoa sp. M6MM]
MDVQDQMQQAHLAMRYEQAQRIMEMAHEKCFAACFDRNADPNCLDDCWNKFENAMQIVNQSVADVAAEQNR